MTTSPAEAFAGCNDTELYQLCRQAGLPVKPTTPRDSLLLLLTGGATEDESYVASLLEAQLKEEVHEVDLWRNAITQFLHDHWDVVESQIDCPAKTKDPKACYQCVDAQVVACIVQNEVNEPYIRLRRK